MGALIDSIIFLTEVPFTERDFGRFGVERLKARGFIVRVWDLTEAVHGQVIQQIEVPDRKEWEGISAFSNKEEVVRAIRQLPRTTIVICLVGYYWKTYFAFRALSSSRVPYAVMVTNILPIPVPKGENPPGQKLRSLLQKVWNTPKKNIFFHVRDKVILRAYPLFGIRAATFCILGGSRCSEIIDYPVGRQTMYVWAHTLDYDLYLDLQERPVPKDPMMGVFLDQYLPFHPDNLYQGTSPPCLAEEYYPQLRHFFDYLKEKYKVHIEIAAHPRSLYERYPDYFGRRPVIRGLTPALIQRSGFVIQHSSTAISFAILFEKPVIFVTNRKIDSNPEACHIGAILSAMASILGKKPILLDEPYSIDWNCELTVDPEAYARYRDLYIKKQGTEERNTWEIVADALLSGSVE